MLLDYDSDQQFRAQLTFNYWQDNGDTQAGQAVMVSPEAPDYLVPGFASEIIARHATVSERNDLRGVRDI